MTLEGREVGIDRQPCGIRLGGHIHIFRHEDRL